MRLERRCRWALHWAAGWHASARGSPSPSILVIRLRISLAWAACIPRPASGTPLLNLPMQEHGSEHSQQRSGMVQLLSRAYLLMHMLHCLCMYIRAIELHIARRCARVASPWFRLAERIVSEAWTEEHEQEPDSGSSSRLPVVKPERGSHRGFERHWTPALTLTIAYISRRITQPLTHRKGHYHLLPHHAHRVQQ